MRTILPIHPTFALLLAAVLALSSCSGSDSPAPLTVEELRVVDELVDYYRLQLLERRNPEKAERLRDTLGATLDEAALAAHAEALGRDPLRGALVLRAVRDSLEGLRDTLLSMDEPAAGEAGLSSESAEVPLGAAER